MMGEVKRDSWKGHLGMEMDLQDARFDPCREATYIVLDVPDWEGASALVDELGPGVDGYKVGLELFHGDGDRALSELAKRGKRIFLDVKLHDIPNTVAGAIRSIARHPGIEMVNVHAAGGERMMVAAREAIDRSYSPPSRPLLIAVTVLTSLDQEDLLSMGVTDDVPSVVARYSRLAAKCNLDGVVASGREISVIRDVTPAGFEIVVPGTRPKGSDAGDQRRTITPDTAIEMGATRLVIGRAVTKEDDKKAALLNIWQAMLQAQP